MKRLLLTAWLLWLLVPVLAGMACARDAAAAEGGTSPGGTATAGSSAEPGSAGELRATQSHESGVDHGWIVAGQPTQERLREVVSLGARVISLRLPAEDPFDEKALVEGLGGTFIRYPTTSADMLAPEFRSGLYDLYDDQIRKGGPVYLHCASSNRAGASWALYNAERRGVPPLQALEMGRQAGMASLETLVVSILGLCDQAGSSCPVGQ